MSGRSTPPLMPTGYLSPLSDVDAADPEAVVSRLRVIVHLLDRAYREQLTLSQAGLIPQAYDDQTHAERGLLVDVLARHVGVLRDLRPTTYRHTREDFQQAVFRVPEPPAQTAEDLNRLYHAALYALMDVCTSRGALSALSRVQPSLADPLRRLLHVTTVALMAGVSSAT